LATLPRRELTSGFCEIAKQAILAGGHLFEQTQTFLREFPPTIIAKSLHLRDLDAFSSLIAEQVSFKARVVTRDEQEAVKKTGRRSRKILNFGHTIGHALEKATNYRALRHGEAVGYGMMFAADLSKKLEFMPAEQVELLYDVVRRCGSFPRLKNVNPADVSEALESDKKRINGSLQWILLRGIGKPTIVPDDQIPQDIFQSTLIDLLER
jgi:3-dehydroquinate synthase